MRRVFWMLTGVGLTALVFWQGRKLLRRATPQGIAEQADRSRRRAAERIGRFMADVRDGMAEREAELVASLGVGSDPAPEAKYARR